MGQAHDHDAVYSTKDSTAVMTSLQYDKTPVVNSAAVAQCTCTVYSEPHLVPWAPYIRGTRGNKQPNLQRRLISLSLHGSYPSSVALAL
jgi:hypothetical protein